VDAAGDATVRRFVNEIGLEEESDEHPVGRGFCSALDDAEFLPHDLVRHVQLDGDSHSDMAEYLLVSACGDNPERWARAEVSARACLEARAELWDAVGVLVEAKLK
jgi:hypothetical protein